MQTAEILCTGTELLLGHTTDKHLSWLAKQLFPLGFRIHRFTVLPDGDSIRSALREALWRKPAVLILSGGLGPTSDDLTREAVAEVLGLKLVESELALEAISERLKARGREFLPCMRKQALLPEGAILLPNRHGTAPGAGVRGAEGVWIFLLPGPPGELQPMFLDYVVPLLREHFPPKEDQVIEKIYTIIGLGESAVEERIGMEIQREGELEVGYCARPNEVDLRLIGKRAAIGRWDGRIRDALGEYLACEDGERLEEVVVRELRCAGKRLAVAESCTGGLIASRLTDVPGASEVFLCGLVAYANEAKTEFLGVPAELIVERGAVSEEVAKWMAESVLRRTGADLAIATTGIAGPGGGSVSKPVGTCFLALASKGEETTCTHVFHPTSRKAFKYAISQLALEWVRKKLKKS